MLVVLYLNEENVHNVILINILRQNNINFDLFYEKNKNCPYLIVNNNKKEIMIEGFDNIIKNVEYIKMLLNL